MQAGGKDLFFAVLSRPGTASPALGTYEGADMLSSDEDESLPETNPLARPATAPDILVGECIHANVTHETCVQI